MARNVRAFIESRSDLGTQLLGRSIPVALAGRHPDFCVILPLFGWYTLNLTMWYDLSPKIREWQILHVIREPRPWIVLQMKSELATNPFTITTKFPTTRLISGERNFFIQAVQRLEHRPRRLLMLGEFAGHGRLFTLSWRLWPK